MIWIALLIGILIWAVYRERRNPFLASPWVIALSTFAQLFFFLVLVFLSLLLFPLILIVFLIFRALGVPFFPNLPFTIHRWTFERMHTHTHAHGHGGFQGAAPATGPRAEAYHVLGLQPGASKRDIRAAYRSLILKHHPDRGGSPERAAKINWARDLLLNE